MNTDGETWSYQNILFYNILCGSIQVDLCYSVSGILCLRLKKNTEKESGVIPKNSMLHHILWDYKSLLCFRAINISFYAWEKKEKKKDLGSLKEHSMFQHILWDQGILEDYMDMEAHKEIRQ